ncbi:MAG: biotin synthase BioB, partial [Alphaproteobacteria bacterium]|nr:biotin synthase BioB [Alphaproteobacteria bacterium]
MLPQYDANDKFLGTVEDAEALLALPLGDLLDIARQVYRKHFDPNAVQISTLLNIKTGSCPENCSYCPQSAHYDTGLKKEPLMSVETVVAAAKQAKETGASRFCMGAAWRGPKDAEVEIVSQMVREVKALGMETCVTLGLLKEHQA